MKTTTLKNVELEMEDETLFVPKHKGLSNRVVQDVGQAMLYLLERNDKVTSQDLVQLARPVSSKLHKHFDWNNNSAGEKYRLHQARQYICWIDIKTVEQGQSKAFANIKQNNTRGYMLVSTAIAQPELRKQMLNVALREVTYWSNQYKTLKELKPIFKAVQNVKRKITS